MEVSNCVVAGWISLLAAQRLPIILILERLVSIVETSFVKYHTLVNIWPQRFITNDKQAH